MRDILFRGKRIDNGEWVEGYLVISDERYFIGIFPECVTSLCYPDDIYTFTSFVEIIPSTLGQYTGLTDKNGVKIFEDDIVRVHDTLLRCDEPRHEFIGVVGFKDASFTITDDCFTHYRWQDYEIEVIGNTHDATPWKRCSGTL